VAAEPIVETGLISGGSFLRFDITNSMLTSWIILGVLVLLVFLGTRRWEMVPSGAQNLIEAVGEAFFNLVTSIAGETNGRRFFPVVATIFFMVVAFNWAGLLPFFGTVGEVHEEEHGFVFKDGPVLYTKLSNLGELSSPSIDEDDADAEEQYRDEIEAGNKVGELFPFLRAPASDLNTPLALAIVSAIAVETWAIRSLGIGYGKKFFNFGGIFRGIFRLNPAMMFSGIIDAFVGILELISELVRLVSFTFRLFGNIFAGEVVITMFTFLAPLVITTLIFYPLEIFVGIIQAFIFATLTLVFAMMAVSHGDHDAHAEHEEDKRHHAEGGAEAPAH
jgi:F-type H+-transporting ATPase subunit a